MCFRWWVDEWIGEKMFSQSDAGGGDLVSSFWDSLNLNALVEKNNKTICDKSAGGDFSFQRDEKKKEGRKQTNKAAERA